MEYRCIKIGGITMIELSTVRNVLEETAMKLTDFRGSL